MDKQWHNPSRATIIDRAIDSGIQRWLQMTSPWLIRDVVATAAARCHRRSRPGPQLRPHPNRRADPLSVICPWVCLLSRRNLVSRHFDFLIFSFFLSFFLSFYLSRVCLLARKVFRVNHARITGSAPPLPAPPLPVFLLRKLHTRGNRPSTPH